MPLEKLGQKYFQKELEKKSITTTFQNNNNNNILLHSMISVLFLIANCPILNYHGSNVKSRFVKWMLSGCGSFV